MCDFFRTCIDRGVKIALGTDAHVPWEAGGLTGHLAVLREAAGTDDVEGLLAFGPSVPTTDRPAD